MRFIIILIFCISSAAYNLNADFVTDFQKAQSLYLTHRDTQAAAAFAKLAQSEKNPALRDKALLYAGRSLARQKNKNIEQALKTVQQISSPQLKTFAEIETLYYFRKYPELITKFSQTGLDGLGDDYTYLACYYRGHAYFKSKKYPEARKDLEQAADSAGSDKEIGILACYDLAQAELELEKMQQAFKIVEKVAVKMSDAKNILAYQKCVRLAASILLSGEKYAEAKEFLDRYSDINSKTVRGYSRFCLYALYADIELKLGNQEQAKKWYQRAVAAGDYGKETGQVKAKLERLK